MDFFGIGMAEILLVLVVALIIWGPGRMAEIGKTLGKIVHNLKKVTSDLTTQVTREIEEQKEERPPRQHKGSESIDKHSINRNEQ